MLKQPYFASLEAKTELAVSESERGTTAHLTGSLRNIVVTRNEGLLEILVLRSETDRAVHEIVGLDRLLKDVGGFAL